LFAGDSVFPAVDLILLRLKEVDAKPKDVVKEPTQLSLT